MLCAGAVIKQRMQIHGSEHRSVWDAARNVYRAEGMRAFYVYASPPSCTSVGAQAVDAGPTPPPSR